jgi:spore germination protein KC
LRDLKTAVDKELDFSHSRIIILGKGILTLDIKDATDLVLRRRDIQMVSWISVGEPTAEEVLKLETPSEVASSISLVNFFTETAVDSPLIVPTFLFDFQRKMNEKGIDPVLPIIQIDKKEKKYIVNRSIVIGEKKNVELTSHQTRMYSSLSGEKNQLNLEVEHNDYDDYKFGLFIDSSNVKYKIITENDNPIIKMDVSLSGIIEDAKINTDAKKLEHYGQEASKLAKAHLTEVLQFFQKEQIDPIGFGLRYKATRLNTNNTYKVWQDIYPKIKFDVNVDVNVKSTGTIE